MEEEGIKLMNDIKSISNPLDDLFITKTVSGINLAKAYLAFPPQMKFIPSDIELEKLIWNAAKFRYVKDNPKII